MKLKSFLNFDIVWITPGVVFMAIPGNDSVCRNYAVCNAIRRNRYEKIVQYIHFADNSVLNNADKIRRLVTYTA